MLMHWLIYAAIGWWIGGARERRRHRERTSGEIKTTLETGLPPPESAVGKKAKAVADAQAEKLADPPPVHGSARWATADDASAILDADHRANLAQGSRKLWLGNLAETDGDGPPVVASYPGHLMTVAGTGQGKSATQIIANLLTYTGSVVVIDPKGELYAATAARRRSFGKVYRLAPLARTGEPKSDRYNPLDELDDPREPGREMGSRARRLAEMLMVRQGQKGAAEATFFENEAINLLTAVILYAKEGSWLLKKPRMGTLSEVRRICTLPILGARKERKEHTEYIEDVFEAMGNSLMELVRRQGRLFGSYDPKLLGSFLSEINSNLAFWDGHDGFSEVTARSDFKFADLEREPVTVYLTIPFKDMPTSFRFLRAMIGMAFGALEEKAEAKEASVLFVLDEFAALKDMEFMREAVAQMRSSGAWFWFFVQDIAQLEGIYGRWADVFLSQTDHQVFFGGTLDGATKKHISTALGVTTFPYRDASVTWSHSVGMSDGMSEQPTQIGGVNRGRNIGQSVNIAEPVVLAPKPLLTPFEVGTFLSERRPGESHPSTAIIFSKQAGGYPIKARRQHWRSIPELAPEPEPSAETVATTVVRMPVRRRSAAGGS
jgi:type IV secretion system protein VirD4